MCSVRHALPAISAGTEKKGGARQGETAHASCSNNRANKARRTINSKLRGIQAIKMRTRVRTARVSGDKYLNFVRRDAQRYNPPVVSASRGRDFHGGFHDFRGYIFLC